LRIVLRPPGPREVLGKFQLADAADAIVAVEDDGAGGGCALINGENETAHSEPLTVRRNESQRDALKASRTSAQGHLRVRLRARCSVFSQKCGAVMSWTRAR